MDYQDKKDSLTKAQKDNGTQPGTQYGAGGESEAREFLELLFKAHLQQSGGFVEILNKRIGQKQTDKPLYFDTLPGLLERVNTLTGDVWFGVAPRDIQRAFKKAITNITCIWTDIDVGTEGHKAPGSFDTKEEALKTIDGFPLKPSIIVESGHGLHLYWLLKESCKELDTAEEILNGIGKELQGDPGTWERTRLLRLPGTLNHNAPDSPQECKILSKNSLRYDLKDFETYRVIGLREFESIPEIVFDKSTPLFDIEDLSINKMAPEIVNLIQNSNTNGKYMKIDQRTGELGVDRSLRDQAVILELLKTGHSNEVIRGIFSNKSYPVSDKYLDMGKRGDYYLALSIKKAQVFLDSGAIQEKKKNELIVPKKADIILSTALIPDFDFPLMLERDGQQLLTLVYENKLTDMKVRADVNKELLKELNITEDDLKYREATWEGSIARYLMDKKARTGKEIIEGTIEEIAKFLCPGKLRQEDYRKAEVNLKSLALRQYIVKHDGHDVVFMVINPFKFDENTKTFTVGLSALVPKIVGEVIGAKEGTLYINKTQTEYNPKQNKYDYNIRQYFSSIKHITKRIPQINGITLLEKSGHLADVELKRKTYRNSEAQKVINKFVKIGLKEYGLIVNCLKNYSTIKDVRKRIYSIDLSDKRKFIKHDQGFRDTLAKWISNQPGNHDLIICINRAQGLFNRYGVEAVKKAYNSNFQTEGFNISKLEQILSPGARG